MDSTGQKLDAEKKDLARLKEEVEELKSGLDSDLTGRPKTNIYYMTFGYFNLSNGLN